MADGSTLYGTTILDALKSKTSLATNSTGAIIEGAPVANSKTIVIDGDYRGQYQFNINKKVPYQENGAGITITRILVQSSVSPTTQLVFDLKYCDAQTTVFPSTNPTIINTLNTTAGAFDSGVVSFAVPTGHPMYLQFNADPTDLNVNWTTTITYTVN